METKELLLVLGAFLLMIGAVSPIVPVEEEYTTTEPYETTETYTEEVPQTVRKDLEYSESDQGSYDHFWTDRTDVYLEVQNIDSESGEFWVRFDVTTTEGESTLTTDRVFLNPGESNRFEKTAAGSFEDATYIVENSGKEVTEYREVEKERTVTETREVTETETVQKSLIELVLY